MRSAICTVRVRAVFLRALGIGLLLAAGPARADFWLDKSYDFDIGAIVIQPEAPPLIRAAAELFAAHWLRAASAELPIGTEPAPGINIWLGAGVMPKQIVSPDELEDLGTQGYLIRTFTPSKRNASLGIGPHLVIAGRHDQGTLNGVSDFFEKAAGARWYAPGETAVRTFVFSGIETFNDTFIPGFKYREVGYHARHTGHEAWLPWRRALHLPSEYTHSTRLYPKEWEGGPAEPALKGDGAAFELEALAAEAIAWIDAHRDTPTPKLPRGARVVVWLDDADRPVVAWTLNAIPPVRAHFGVAPSGQGVPSERLADALALANAVAKALEAPDTAASLVKLELAADCPLPPEGGAVHGNVIIQLSNAACDFSQPLASEHTPENARFVEALGRWTRAARELFVADYVCSLHTPVTPFPNEQRMAENVFLYQRMGVSGVYAESWDLPELPVSPDEEMFSHFLAELYWNPDRLVEVQIEAQLNRSYFLSGPGIAAARGAYANAAAAAGGLHPYGPPAWLGTGAAMAATASLAAAAATPDLPAAVKSRIRNYSAVALYSGLVAAPHLAEREGGTRVWARPEGITLEQVVAELKEIGYGVVTPQADVLARISDDCGGQTPPREQPYSEAAPPQ